MSTDKDKCHFRKGYLGGVLFLAIIGVISIYTFAHVRRRINSPSNVDRLTTIGPIVALDDNVLVRKVPDFIIIGVRKGGTKALISILGSHPQILSAKGEVHFFDNPDMYTDEGGMSWYISRMPLSKKGELVVEKTPSYFVNADVPKRIFESLPQSLKLILIVRDPITRSISDFTQLDAKRMRFNRTRPSLEKVVFKSNGDIINTTSVIRDSLYDVHYRRWLQYFNRNRILIIDGDQLASSPLKELVKVERYLTIDSYFTPEKLYFNNTKGFYCWKTETNSSKCLGSAKGRKHPEISEDTKLKLQMYFKPHMFRFCEMAHLNISLCSVSYSYETLSTN